MVNKIRSTFTGLYTLDEVRAVCLYLLTEVHEVGDGEDRAIFILITS